MINFEGLLNILVNGDVAFIIIGGFAGTIHGSSIPTIDLDVLYARDADNLAGLATALQPISPSLRGAPPGLPFCLDQETLSRGLNFTLNTKLGPLNLLGEVIGGGPFNDLKSHSVQVEIYKQKCLCIDLPKLIDLKRAAGRLKDLQAVATLEKLLNSRKP